MELTLTPDIESAIKKQAIRRGITPERLAIESLRTLFIHTDEKIGESPASLADFLNGYVGVIHSSQVVEGGAQMSEATGATFATLMMQKRIQDQL